MGAPVGSMYVVIPYATGVISGIDLYLPPAEDWITNGEFESGFDGWSTTGDVSAGTPRTGSNAATLWGADTSVISQTVNIPSDAQTPILSWMWNAENLSPATHKVTVTLTTGAESYTVPLDLNEQGWQHGWTPADQYIGQQVDVIFEYQDLSGSGAPDSTLTLDEISFGEYMRQIWHIYMPLIMRNS